SETLPGWPTNSAAHTDDAGGIVGPDWITPQSGTMQYWPYDIIRDVNIFITEIPNGKLSDDIKKVMLGQAKFLRAYLYFQMVKRYGGVPILKMPQKLTDSLSVSRNSTLECFNFIIQDLDEAFNSLPPRFE